MWCDWFEKSRYWTDYLGNWKPSRTLLETRLWQKCKKCQDAVHDLTNLTDIYRPISDQETHLLR